MNEEKYREKLMLLPIKVLQKRADIYFSKSRRMESASPEGIVQCITCGYRESWETFDCGHFIQREHLQIRYDRRNTFPQCGSCNRFKGGRHSIFRDKLVEKFGKEVVEEMEAKKYSLIDSFRHRETCIETIIESKRIIKRLKLNE